MKRVLVALGVVLLLVTVLAVVATRRWYAQATARLIRLRALRANPLRVHEPSACFEAVRGPRLWIDLSLQYVLRDFLRGEPLPDELQPDFGAMRSAMQGFFECPLPEVVSTEEAQKMTELLVAAVMIRDELHRGDPLRAEVMCLSALQWVPVLRRSGAELDALARFVGSLEVPCRDAFAQRGASQARARSIEAIARSLETAEQETAHLYAELVLRALEQHGQPTLTRVLALWRDARRVEQAEATWDALRDATDDRERERASDAFDLVLDASAVFTAPRERLINRWRAAERLRRAVEEVAK